MEKTIWSIIPKGLFGLWLVSSFAPGLYFTKTQNSRLIRDEAGAVVTVSISPTRSGNPRKPQTRIKIIPNSTLEKKKSLLELQPSFLCEEQIKPTHFLDAKFDEGRSSRSLHPPQLLEVCVCTLLISYTLLGFFFFFFLWLFI